MQARGGQVNGICGAAVPGMMALTTGLHTGSVPLVVEALDVSPTADGDWDDIVEVSFVTDDANLALSAFDDTAEFQLPAAGTYRVRYCASGMDAAHSATRMPDEPVIDRYRLTFWPAPAAPDAIVRQTSEMAAYWHRVARDTPAPPPPPTAEELAAAARAKAVEQAARRQHVQDVLEAQRWGGRRPTERLRAIGGNAAYLAQLDRELVEAVAALDPDRQRATAVWAARRVCESVPPTDIDWPSALDAAERGDPPPPPFDNPREAWAAAFPGPKTVTVTVVGEAQPAPHRLHPKAAALGAVLAACGLDPARAAVDATVAAVHQLPEATEFLAEVRRRLELPPRSDPSPTASSTDGSTAPPTLRPTLRPTRTPMAIDPRPRQPPPSPR